MATFFTADTHFGHDSIRRYCDRPFATVGEMDAALIKRWNTVVRPGDTVYHLGDFAYRNKKPAGVYLSQLAGTIHLIRGNHEADTLADCGDRFASVSDLTTVTADGQKIVLCHYAMRVWDGSHRGAWQLYGHTHGALPEDPHRLSLDVGVDAHDYAPVPFERVRELMRARDPIDPILGPLRRGPRAG